MEKYIDRLVTDKDTLTITSSDLDENTTFTYDPLTVTTNDLFDDPLDFGEITINLPVDFITSMPDMKRVNEMCELYPALKLAYEKFKNCYNLCIDDFNQIKGDN